MDIKHQTNQNSHVLTGKTDQPSLSVKPAPDSAASLSIPPPNTFAKSSRGASSPLLGASGVSLFLLFSIPALDGKVGNISLDFGFGSSRKYGWARHSLAVGRDAGFRASSVERSDRPDEVR